MKKALFIISIFICSCTLVFSQSTLKVGDKATIKFDKTLQSPFKEINSAEELKGKVVLLEFWATWCAPCIKAFPHLNELKTKFKDLDFEIIAITYESEELINETLEKHPLNAWIGINEDKSLFMEYAVQTIPQTFLINKEGIIVERLRPSGVTEEKIKKLLDD